MAHWSETSIENLLVNSHAQDNFQIALKEWYYTGYLEDLLDQRETCQLCAQPNLRYHFEIRNRVTGSILWVGSSCIEKFEITVYDESGHELIGDERTKLLESDRKKKQTEMALEPLRRLWQKEGVEHETIKNYVDAFKKRNGFVPQHLLWLFREMKRQNISYVPELYKVTLRSEADRDSLYKMSDDERGVIWFSLSIQQQKRYEDGEKAYQQRMAPLQTENEIRDSQHKPEPLPDVSYKFFVDFYDRQGIVLERIFNDNLRFLRALAQEVVNANDECAKAEVRISLTNYLVGTYHKND
jgi:hypothetical protein